MFLQNEISCTSSLYICRQRIRPQNRHMDFSRRCCHFISRPYDGSVSIT